MHADLGLADADRRRLAALAHRLGRRVLRDVATVATPDTLLRWHRQLIARAPNLALSDRLICGLASIFLSPGRIRKVAIGLRPSTLLAFHQGLVHRKYRRLFSSSQCRRAPGPKGPSDALIQAIVELKSRNPRFGCPRIARIIAHTFGVDIDKNVAHRVLAKHYRPCPPQEPSTPKCPRYGFRPTVSGVVHEDVLAA